MRRWHHKLQLVISMEACNGEMRPGSYHLNVICLCISFTIYNRQVTIIPMKGCVLVRHNCAIFWLCYWGCWSLNSTSQSLLDGSSLIISTCTTSSLMFTSHAVDFSEHTFLVNDIVRYVVLKTNNLQSFPDLWARVSVSVPFRHTYHMYSLCHCQNFRGRWPCQIWFGCFNNSSSSRPCHKIFARCCCHAFKFQRCWSTNAFVVTVCLGGRFTCNTCGHLFLRVGWVGWW